MKYGIVLLVILVGIVLLCIRTRMSSNEKLKRKLEQSFGKAPIHQDYQTDAISTYHHRWDSQANGIDPTTWDDLDMDQVFRRINVCCTSVGEEYLYHILHTPCHHTEELAKREKLIAYLTGNKSQRLRLQMILSKLGKERANGLAFLINNEALEPLEHSVMYSVLAGIPLFCMMLIPFVPSLGIGLAATSFVANVAVYYIVKRTIEADLMALEYFCSMLWCCHKIGKIKDNALTPYLADLKNNDKVFQSLRSKIPVVSKKGFSDADIFVEYIKIFFLSDIRHYNKVIRCMARHSDCLRELYKELGELDVSICILSFRESLPFCCVPTFHAENAVHFHGLYHPLLSAPVANDARIQRNCIITGSNASGKSTFIKAVAVNAILAQTIYTCAAHDYAARFSLVITSMAVRDDISKGESYFITEMKSLKRILDKIAQRPCLCVIDEILKGTNTIERIAASAAVLQFLCSQNGLCIVATHDMELTEILKDAYDNVHFSEQITENGVFFDYRIKDGASQTRNALKLLHFMDFDQQLVQNAESLVDQFVTNHRWRTHR